MRQGSAAEDTRCRTGDSSCAKEETSMARERIWTGLTVMGLLLASSLARAATPEQILQYRPKQEGIQYSTPRPEEYASCKVHWTKPQGGPGQWTSAPCR